MSAPTPVPANPSPPPVATTPPPVSSSPPPVATPPPASAPAPPVVSPPPASSPPPLVVSPPPASSPPPPVVSPPPASSPPPPVVSPPPASSPPPPATNTPPPPASYPPPKASPPPPDASPPPPVKPGTPFSSPPPPTTRSPPPPPITASSPPPPPVSPSTSSSSSSTGLVVGIAVAGGAVLVVLCLLFFFCIKKKKRDQTENYHPPPSTGAKDSTYGAQQQNARPPADYVIGMTRNPSSSPPPQPVNSSSGGSGTNYSGSPLSPGIAMSFSNSTFTYDELARATDGFSDANLLGQGGFGFVHKGVLPNGKEVAVKQLKIGSGQGEREFQAEVEIISRVHHKHLVSLVGYCMTGSQRLLVYEFVPNNTLEFHLHGNGRRPTMEWSTRLKIALGSAKGLAYLHEDCHPKIIHRDIKAANILIDFKFEAMVADFGLAKLSSDLNTHVSTRVMGTFGYLAPEYAASGKLTEKSDVFSFGVMLLELITGRTPVDKTNSYTDDSLVEWARPLLSRALEEGGNLNNLVDPRLENKYNPNEMKRMVACAAACVRHSAKRRPKMSQIVRALEGEVSLDDLNEGVKPGHSSDYDTKQYKEDMMKFRKMALGTQEYSTTTDTSYGLTTTPSGSSSENH